MKFTEICGESRGLRPNLAELASGLAEDASQPFTLMDTAQVTKKYLDFVADHPDVQPVVDLDICTGDSNDNVIDLFKSLGVTRFSAKNKLELDQAIKAGLRGDQLMFLSPLKPASQMKFALVHGVSTIGCGSVNEVAKAVKVREQIGAESALKIVVMLNVSNLATFESLASILEEKQVDVIGVSLHGEAEDMAAFSKAVAMARLLFEYGCQIGCNMEVLDIGKLMSGEKEQLEAVASQFKAQSGVQTLAHVSHNVTLNAYGLVVQIQAVSQDRSYLIVNDSIYGAFSGVLAGDQVQDPHLVSGTSKGRCTVLGCSGDDVDIIVTDVDVLGEAGDCLVFPNVWSGTSLRLATPWTEPETASDIAELDDLYALPDLSEEVLEMMFKI